MPVEDLLYPEHAKQRAAAHKLEAVKAFLQWAELSHDVLLCQRLSPEQRVELAGGEIAMNVPEIAEGVDLDALLFEWQGFSADKLRAEESAKSISGECVIHDHHGAPYCETHKCGALDTDRCNKPGCLHCDEAKVQH